MKTTNNILAIFLMTALSFPVMADHKHGNGKEKFFDRAQVLRVKPIYKEVKVSLPGRKCKHRDRHATKKQHYRQRQGEAVLVGGIIGGVLGHEVSKHTGNDTATFAGTLIGAAIGHDASRSQRHERYSNNGHRNKKHCVKTERVRYERRLVGYKVKYRYGGNTYRTRMRNHPGSTIKVRVKIVPMVDLIH